MATPLTFSFILSTPVPAIRSSAVPPRTRPTGPGLTNILTADVRAFAKSPEITIWSSKLAAVFLISAVTLYPYPLLPYLPLSIKARSCSERNLGV